jgi:uncharacterized protein YqjF (DUF2071 family)
MPAFLTAEWRYLAIANFEVDPALLRPLVPNGTELDRWQDRALVSVVGFMFLNTRLCGLAIPYHRSFEEINLRFYVRREIGQESRRGVVFIREVVPRRAIAVAARVFYNEKYIALPASHTLHFAANGSDIESARYSWRLGAEPMALEVRASGSARPLPPGSEAEFITEHYWGYAVQRDGSTVEYAVEHPPWRVWPGVAASLTGDMSRLYGHAFAEMLGARPVSALIAEGSPVVVHRGRKITA